MQDILKLKVRTSRSKHPCILIAIVQSAAINTVFGVSMTTRRQMLKIKVLRAHIATFPCIYSLFTGNVRSESGEN